MELTSHLCNLMKATNVNFVFCGKPISYEEVFAETGLLPALAQRANQVCSLCLGYGIGATFTEAEKSVLGVQVQFDEVTPAVLRLLYIYDALLEIIKASAVADQVSLDELLYD